MEYSYLKRNEIILHSIISRFNFALRSERGVKFRPLQEIGSHTWKTWPYGKHKGTEIKLLPNDYIIWAIDNMDVLNQDNSNYNFDLAHSLKAEIENRLR